jgi:choline kinase
MKAIILAAGRGSRMGQGTKDIPKCMMRLFGKTLLEQCIQTLIASGFEKQDIAIVTGYKAEKITVDGVKYFHNKDWENTNMFVSLTMASEWLEKEPCIVCYSDIVFDVSPIMKLREDPSKLAITYYTEYWELWKQRFENPLEDLETFQLEDGFLKEIGKKPTSPEDMEGQFMGLIKITPEGWETIQEAIKLPMSKPISKLDMTTLLQHLIEFGCKINAIKTSELWLECDNQKDIQLYETIFNKGEHLS